MTRRAGSAHRTGLDLVGDAARPRARVRRAGRGRAAGERWCARRVQAVIPLWADHLGLQASVTSLIYGLAAGLEMLVFYPAGHLMDRKVRLWVALPSMLIMAWRC